MPSATVFITTIAINLLALAIPLFSIQIYDRIIAQQGYATLYVLGAGVAAALLLELALRLLRGWLISRAAARTEARLSALAFRSLAHADLEAIQSQTTGSLLQGFQAIGRLREFHGGQAFITLLELPFGALYLVAIAYLGGPLVFVPLALLTLFTWRALSLSCDLQQAMLRRERADRRRYDFLAETLAGIHTIKACGAEQRQLRRYDGLQQDLNGSNYAAVAIANKAAGDGALYGQIMLGTMTLAGAYLAGGGSLLFWPAYQLTLGGLIACVLLAGRVMQPVQRALGLWHRFQEGQLAERSLQTLHGLSLRAGAQPRVPDTPDLSGRPAALALADVAFAYPGEARILQGINLSLAPGEAISIDGAPGAGISTLLKLVSGLYAPGAGTVRLDGLPLGAGAAALAELPPGIAYLRPDAGIMRGTVADNLTRFGLIRLAEMLPLARLLDLEQDIAQLPLGYATPLLGTQADAVPPGFKQRLALARALAPLHGQQPRLVIYDAADRGLDARGYSALLTLLGRMRGRVTLVLATGDANIRALAGRHYRLQDGALRIISNDIEAHWGITSRIAARQATLQGSLQPEWGEVGG